MPPSLAMHDVEIERRMTHAVQSLPVRTVPGRSPGFPRERYPSMLLVLERLAVIVDARHLWRGKVT